jgi:hypothetical protein
MDIISSSHHDHHIITPPSTSSSSSSSATFYIPKKDIVRDIRYNKSQINQSNSRELSQQTIANDTCYLSGGGEVISYLYNPGHADGADTYQIGRLAVK